MQKVLIVDDEVKICSLITELIDWEALDLRPAGYAHDEPGAMQALLDRRPDIVITDIRMPGGNGLNFIEKAKTSSPGVKFIVISGYKEFELVHRAIRLGVEDFLLKPLQRTELISTLRKLLASPRIDQSDSPNGSPTLLDRNRFIVELCNHEGERADWQMADINGEYQYHFGQGLFQVVHFKVEHPAFVKNEYIEFLKDLCARIHRLLAPEMLDCDYHFSQYGDLYFVLNYPERAQKAVSTKLNTASCRISQEINRIGLRHYVTGVGIPCTGIDKLPHSLFTARFATKSRLALGSNRLIHTEKIYTKEGPGHQSQCLDAKFQEEFSKCVEFIDTRALQSLLETLYEDQYALFLRNPALPYNINESLIALFYSCIAKYGLLTSFTPGNQATLMQYHANTFSLDKSKGLILQSFVEELSQIQAKQEPGQHHAITVAKQYICNNYQKNITLEELAGITYLNPVYLSILFKNKTGRNFSNYLTDVRINQAKLLLKDMRYNITQIAQLVGYKDAKYFSKIFHATTGVRPKEYRQLHSANLD